MMSLNLRSNCSSNGQNSYSWVIEGTSICDEGQRKDLIEDVRTLIGSTRRYCHDNNLKGPQEIWLVWPGTFFSNPWRQKLI